MKLTLFTICWPCTMESRWLINQDNCLGSWERLIPRPEIILCGDEQGLAETAKERGYVHTPDVEYLYGAPLVSSAFEKALECATGDVIGWGTCDSMLTQEFMTAVKAVADRFERFLMIGCRTNLEFFERVDFKSGWQEYIRRRWAKDGVLEDVTAVDYFLFRHGHPVNVNMPQFCIGGIGWDTWIVHNTLRLGFDVVDVTKAVTLFHQHHHIRIDRKKARNVHNTTLRLARLKEEGQTRRDVKGRVNSGQWWMESDFTIHPK